VHQGKEQVLNQATDLVQGW